jgi:hypothetical protein
MNAWLRIIYEPLDPIQINLSLLGVECLLPVAIICGVCVLATAVWVLAVGKYTWSQSRHA